MQKLYRKIFQFLAALFLLSLVAVSIFAIDVFNPLLFAPLHSAIRSERSWAVKILAKSALREQKIRGFKGGCYKPIDYAASQGSIEYVDLLLDAGADPTGCRDHILSTSVKHPDLIAHLLTDREYAVSAEGQFPEVVEAARLTVACRATVEEPDRDLLVSASLRHFIAAGLEEDTLVEYYPSRSDGYIAPLLSTAVLRGCTNQVDTLIEMGADVYLADEYVEEFFRQKRFYFSRASGIVWPTNYPTEIGKSETARRNIANLKRLAGK